MKRKPRVLLLQTDNDAPGFFRIGEPYGEIWPKMPEIDWHTSYAVGEMMLENFTREILWADAIITQRPFSEGHLWLNRFAAGYGKTLVIDFDDWLLGVPKNSPAAGNQGKAGPGYQWLKASLPLASHLHVSTPELARLFAPHFKGQIHTFLNGLPTRHEKFSPEFNRRAELRTDRTVVMWHGTPCHEETSKQLNKIMRAVARERPDLLFAICSTQQAWIHKLEVPDSQKINIMGHEVRMFAGVPSLADIHLTPIPVRNSFNDGKSELKVLQAAIWKLPAISSPTAPYLRFHELSGGANPIVNSNQVMDWKDAILALVDDPARRRELGEQGYRAVVRHYDLDVVNEGRRQFWRKLFENHPDPEICLEPQEPRDRQPASASPLAAR